MDWDNGKELIHPPIRPSIHPSSHAADVHPLRWRWRWSNDKVTGGTPRNGGRSAWSASQPPERIPGDQWKGRWRGPGLPAETAGWGTSRAGLGRAGPGRVGTGTEKGEGKRKEGRKGNEKKVKRKEWKEGSFKNTAMAMGALVPRPSPRSPACSLTRSLYTHNAVIINTCDNLSHPVIAVASRCHRINRSQFMCHWASQVWDAFLFCQPPSSSVLRLGGNPLTFGVLRRHAAAISEPGSSSSILKQFSTLVGWGNPGFELAWRAFAAAASVMFQVGVKPPTLISLAVRS